MTARDVKKRPKKESRIPTFASYEEEAEWWDTHDITDYLDEMEPVKVTFNLEPMASLTVDLDAHTMKRVRAEAKKQGIPPETLIFIWILERFQSQDQAEAERAAPDA